MQYTRTRQTLTLYNMHRNQHLYMWTPLPRAWNVNSMRPTEASVPTAALHPLNLSVTHLFTNTQTKRWAYWCRQWVKRKKKRLWVGCFDAKMSVSTWRALAHTPRNACTNGFRTSETVGGDFRRYFWTTFLRHFPKTSGISLKKFQPMCHSTAGEAKIHSQHQ